MAKTGLLLPSEPLFIVDKSWALNGTSRRANKGNSDLFGSENFKVLKPGHGQTSGSTQLASPALQATLSNVIRSKEGLQFIAANEPGGRQDKQARKAVRKHARQYVNHAQNKKSKGRSHSWPKSSASESPVGSKEIDECALEIEQCMTLKGTIPDSSLALYGNDNAKDPIGLENYLHYYRSMIAQSAYPLEKYMNFEFNPVRGTCFPLALSDRLFLQTIMLISAIHHSYLSDASEPELADALARRVLQELRSRIAQKDVSDATLLSVSCIALLENLMGHHDQWRVHAMGLNEMLQLRGGVDTIDTSIRWKIYRADLVGAVDHDTKPLLPYPGMRSNLNEIKIECLNLKDTVFLDSLASCGMSDHLQGIYRHIHHVTHIVKHSIEEKVPVSTYFYDNSCLQIQHDLLQTTAGNALDESWRLAGLIYVNTFIKARPFAPKNCAVLCQKLRVAFSSAFKLVCVKSSHFWLAFIGGLASTGTNHHEWFVQRLTHIVQACGCTAWDETKDVLSKVLWLDVLHNTYGQQLWSEISDFASQSD